MQQQSTYIPKVPQKDIQQVFTYSQFINTIRIIKNEQDYKYLKPLQLQNFVYEKDITPSHFRQLVIQFFYLLYSCQHKRIVPIPADNQSFLCYSLQANTVYFCIKQFLTFGSSPLKQFDSMIPYFLYYKNFVTAMHPHWKNSQKRGPVIKRQTLTADYFLKDINENIKNQFKSEKQAFNNFQKGQLFIQTSILLRIRNSALVCIFRKGTQLLQLFKKHRKIQYHLSQQYNERKKRKTNIQKILQTQKNIQKNIEQFFINMKTNPRYYKIEEKKKPNVNTPIINNNNKLSIGLKVFELMDMRKGQSSMEIEQDYYNLYEIEYCSLKNMIIVKMITDLILDWATSDSILFKWNTLTFQTSNVGLQTIEKLDQQKKIKKFVVIRGTSYFNRKQPVLQKMLTLIDITMATYKSIELQMKSQTFFAKNLNKIDESYAKINHYLRTIHRSCIRSYSSIMLEDGI